MAAAVAAVHPYAVDVASGVEAAPGVKDEVKLAAFFAALAAPAAPAPAAPAAAAAPAATAAAAAPSGAPEPAPIG